MKAVLPQNETVRIQTLRQYKILDTPPEAAFDDLTRLAAQICGAPIALISFIDESRQWFKSKVGLDIQSTSRELAFCTHAILQPHNPLIISDTLLDERFATNPLVASDPYIRFYAGASLITPQGYTLGTLCVVDRVPRQLSSEQIQALQTLSRQVVTQLELKLYLCKLESITATQHQQIEYLISALDHDLRTPILANRNTLYAMLGGAFGSVNNSYVDVLEDCYQANEDLLRLVEALLNISRYKTEANKNLKYEILDWKNIFIQATSHVATIFQQKCTIKYKIPDSLPIAYGKPLEIQQVVQNLLNNTVELSKLNQEITLEVRLAEFETIKILVRANGLEIPYLGKEMLFNGLIQGRGRHNIDKLGLYLCRQIVEAHKGTINAESIPDEGTTFWFTLPITSLKN
ncbi:MAG: GAF domain-containing sensor histidine kinase [Nostoc desertorum CM1-VF14]|jgi:signal transduction histidine kinase|nr:GAF domain-containing sensor histidine kinase [Nostoc desertorum CM1-VF14]